MLVANFEFIKYLSDNTKDYNGKYCDQIKLLPQLYQLLCDLLSSSDIHQYSKSDIYLTMGYLFYPDDVYPEEQHGAIGFIDDLMLIIHTLNNAINRSGKNAVYNHWNDDYSLSLLCQEDFANMSDEYNSLYLEVLNMVGFTD